MLDKLDTILERVNEINEKLSQPEIISDNKLMVKLSKELKNLQPIADLYNEYKKSKQDLIDAEEMIALESDAEMKEFLTAEIEVQKEKQQKMEEELKILLLPKDENDDKNVILEIRAGAGGEEAALFGAEILRMYNKYAERNRWKFEITELNDTELGGVKEATALIKGTNVYEKLKYESGVHRVQRVPDTETQGRVHTSTITVAVLPEVEEVEFEILDKDLKIDTCRSSGAGGQNVNKTESAIRITHLPSGLVVECQDERSQHKNKDRAMQILRSKLYEAEQAKQSAALASERRSQIGSGDRSERIRTYNFPQNRVTDHRLSGDAKNFNIQNIINGDLDGLIDSLVTADQAAKLQAQTEA